MRKLPALIVAAGLLASLTACSTSTAPGSAGCTTPATGDASSVVTASGKLGSAPTDVKIPTPINTKHTEVSTLIAGKGSVVTTGTPVQIDVTYYSGTTGEVVQAGTYGEDTTPITAGSPVAGPLADALVCSTVGSRLAVALKVSELSSSTAKHTEKSEPAYIAIVDVKKAFLPRANGTLKPGVNNMPAVVTSADGAPGISVPDIAAPTSEKIQVIRKGHGATLTKKDTAVLQYTAVDWASQPETQESSWTNTSILSQTPPTPLKAGEVGSAAAIDLGSTGVTASLRDALVGQTVGSQVMVVLPPAAGATTQTTYIYVFDLLGAYHATATSSAG